MHEYSKHATCFSTFDRPCYGPLLIAQQDVVDFFETVIMYYMRLPTWNWLATHEIRPSDSTTYSLSDIESALMQEYGETPYVGCTGPRYNETVAGADLLDKGLLTRQSETANVVSKDVVRQQIRVEQAA